MVEVLRAEERGATRVGWLESYHSFSFGGYHDPERMGFRALRVINDDYVAGGGGFPTHPHRDMEIITYVLEGALEHQDSLGTRSVIRPGEVQRMSAGTGILHSEFNPSETEAVHLLQIWILPERAGLRPGYEQKAYSEQERRGRLRLVASRNGREGAVTVHQDVELFATLLANGETVSHTLRPGRHAWVHVATGEATINGQALAAGDSAAVTGEAELALSTDSRAEVLLFDLA
jgi:quercetin 2,3-dioxygenase